MRALLVVNPGARRVDASSIKATSEAWSARHHLTVLESTPATLRERLERALPTADAVAVLGGDGVLNLVANILESLRSDVPLVPLPGGSTNVVVRSIGLPRDLGAANLAALDALDAGATSRQGWGRIDGRGFLANAGVGLDAAVVARVEQAPARKRRLGHLWFAAAAAATLWDGSRNFRVERDGEAGAACWALALARMPYSYAGSRPIDVLARDRHCGDGLWLVRIAPVPAHRLLGLGARALLGSGGIDSVNGVTVTHEQGPFTLSSVNAVPAQADGEPLPPAHHRTLRWQHDALRLLGPLPHAP